MHLYRRYYKITSQWIMNALIPKRKKVPTLPYSLLESELFHHACKTPISILLCSLDNVQVELNDKSSNEQTRQIVRRCFEAAKKLELLLNHVKHPETTNDDVFDVSAAVNQVAILTKARRKNCSIIVDMPNVLVTGKKLYFEEALQCLLNNAVEAYNLTKDTKVQVIVKGQLINQTLRVDLIDFGKGMTPTETKFALLAGITYKPGGSGMGLPFAIKTIEQHFKGKINIISSRGFGTRVVLNIPV